MNDLALLDKYCETCLDFINPLLFRDIQERGLVQFINYLPNNSAEAKAVVRARLAKAGKVFGDDEIDQIANDIKRLEALREKLNSLNMADVHKVISVLKEMRQACEPVINYFK